MASKKPATTQPKPPATAPAPQTTASAPAPAGTPAAPGTPTTPATPGAPAMPPLITTTANDSNHGTKVDLQAAVQAVIYGLMTYYQPTDVFHMQAGTFTRDELIAELQKYVTAAQATKASNQQWRADVQSERGMAQYVRELRGGVRGITQARFGKTGAQNLQFGFSLPKPRTKSAATKAAAVVKGQATRKQRNTMGSVQKKDVKSNVKVQLVVTPADGAQGAGGTAPAGGGTQPAAPTMAPPIPAAPATTAPAGAPATAPANGGGTTSTAAVAHAATTNGQ